jgi:hypothetical protein
MRDAALAGDQDPDLFADLVGDGCKIATELMRYDRICRNAPPVDFFEQVERTFFESRCISVNSADSSETSSLIIAEFTMSGQFLTIRGFLRDSLNTSMLGAI